MAELPVDTTLHDGHYTIGPALGVSNWGITYGGRDNLLNRRVAIKELSPAGSQRVGKEVVTPPGMSAATWEKAIASFEREATALNHLDYPSLVPVYDYFTENNSAYMVMKFINGITLDKYVAMSGGRLSEQEAIAYTVRAGRALEALHAASTLHRNIKPSNIIRASNGQLVLIDFGAAREFIADQAMTPAPSTTGGFTPPELLAAAGRKGPSTDVYSLAATCYYLLTGSPISNALDGAASPQVIATLHHALAANPAARPQTVAQFLAELQGRAPVPLALAPMPAAPPPNPPPAPVASLAIPPTAPVNQPARTATPPRSQPARIATPPLGQPAQIATPPPRQPARIATPPPRQPNMPQSVDATMAAPEYLIGQNPAAPPQYMARTEVVSSAAAMPTLPFYPPNQNPSNMPPALLYATSPLNQPARKGNRLLLIIPLISLLLVLVALMDFLLLNKGATNATIGSPGVATATVAVAYSATTGTMLATATTVSLPPSPTLLTLAGAQLPSPPPSDTPLPQLSDTPLPQLSDTPLPPPSATPFAPRATPIVAPPLPATRTPRPPLPPRPTATIPPRRQPTPRPVPPTPRPALPTPRPPVANQPQPNPTTTAAGQLGSAWVLLGHPNFNSFCASQAAGGVARLTKGGNATALDWACFSPQGAKVASVDMAAACSEQFPGFGFNAMNSNPSDPNGWACYRYNVRVAPVQENTYCQGHYPNTIAAVEKGVWYCFQVKNIGPINVNAACASQFGAGALGFWSALAAPNSWNCYRRK